MTPEENPAEHAATCPMCARAVKEREASEGLRCASCLEVFDLGWPLRSEEDPLLCTHCLRVANAPRLPRVGSYGTQSPVKRGTT
jgi:hypothetical protein